MARAGYRIFDADTHIVEPVEPIEEYLSSADRGTLAALGPLVQRSPARGGVSRYRVGRRPELNRRLGSRERIGPSTAVARGLKEREGTPWDVRWQGPPFPSERVNFDAHARVKDMDIECVDVNMILPSGGLLVLQPRRRRARDGHVHGLSPLPQGLLRALSGPPDRRPRRLRS